MGNTCATLQIVRGVFTSRDKILDAIPKAYGKLGFGKAKKSDTQPTRQVLLVPSEDEHAFTLVDNENTTLDTGDLKELAVHLSKQLKTTVVVTTIYDGDAFEFLVYVSGKQVDALVSDSQEHEGSLKILSNTVRKRNWPGWFGLYLITMETMRDPGALAALRSDIEVFNQRMETLCNAKTALAEDTLAALCELTGLSPAGAFTMFGDIAEDPETAIPFSFIRKEIVAPKAAPLPEAKSFPGGIDLRAYLSEDDCPYHLFYPASWPILPKTPATLKWLIVSNAAGFTGCTVTCRLNGAVTAGVVEMKLLAYPFYNGQVTSMTHLAEASWTADEAKGFQEVTIPLNELSVPDLVSESKKQIVLILAFSILAEAPEVFTIEPTLTPYAVPATPLALPPLKVAVQKLSWLPLVSGLNVDLPIQTFSEQSDKEKMIEMTRQQKGYEINLLNHPAIWSGVGILADSGADSYGAAKTYGEAFLKSLPLTTPCQVRVRTQKHMTESAYVGKSAKEFSCDALLGDKLWSKLFDPESNYQTLEIALIPAGYDHPVAAFCVQQALKSWQQSNVIQEQLQGMIGAERLSGAKPDQELTSCLHVYTWMANDPETEKLLGLSVETISQQFSQWLSEQHLLQGWVTQSAQIPTFDLYENYYQTLYESVCLYSWFYSGMNGLLMNREWCLHKLRYVAPMMWLCDSLMSKVDSVKLSEIVEIEKAGHTHRLALNPNSTLNQLEKALLPLLPIEAKRLVPSR